MSFTDADLARLKAEYCSGHPSERDEVIEALLARLEAHERLDEWLEHGQECIRTSWCAGRPTADGGYKWYQSRPIDKTPKCNCGLDESLEAWRKAKEPSK